MPFVWCTLFHLSDFREVLDLTVHHMLCSEQESFYTHWRSSQLKHLQLFYFFFAQCCLDIVSSLINSSWLIISSFWLKSQTTSTQKWTPFSAIFNTTTALDVVCILISFIILDAKANLLDLIRVIVLIGNGTTGQKRTMALNTSLFVSETLLYTFACKAEQTPDKKWLLWDFCRHSWVDLGRKEKTNEQKSPERRLVLITKGWWVQLRSLTAESSRIKEQMRGDK